MWGRRGRRGRRLAPSVLAVAVVAAGGCSAAHHDRGAPPRPAHPVAVATWDGTDLLPAAGRMARSGRIGVYFAVDGDRYSLAAVDVTTGRELWRHVVHQMARREDEVQEPAIDAADGLVYGDDFDEAHAQPGMIALDLQSGRLRWRTPIEPPRDMPVLCGRASLCVTTGRAGVTVFDRATGRRRPGPTGGLYLEIARVGGYLLSTDPDAQQVELGVGDDRGYRRLWTTSYADLYGPGDRSRTTAAGGKRGGIDPRTGASWFGFGLRPPRTGLDNVDSPEYREHADAALRVVFKDRAGHTTARADRVLDCSPWHTGGEVFLCGGRLSADGTHPVLHQVGARSPAGRLRWSRAVDPADDLNAPVPTSDGDVVALTRADGSHPVFLDPHDGRVLDPGDVPDLVFACQSNDGLTAAMLRVRLRVDSDHSAPYVRGGVPEITRLCDRRGDPLPVADALRRGIAVPDWFGPATRVGPRAPADRWVVWMDAFDGTLHGAGPVT
jgi:PQQ-like domain